jgi:hypothetical protein
MLWENDDVVSRIPGNFKRFRQTGFINFRGIFMIVSGKKI